MKAHKYWSLGALACMAGCFYTGCKKLMQAHKYFAYGALGCMGMASRVFISYAGDFEHTARFYMDFRESVVQTLCSYLNQRLISSCL